MASGTSHSELVKDIYLFTPGRPGGGLQTQKLDIAGQRLEDSEPPAWMSSIEDDLLRYFVHREHSTRSGRSEDENEERRNQGSDSFGYGLDTLRPDVPALLMLGKQERNGLRGRECLGDMLQRVLLFSRLGSDQPYKVGRLDIAETIDLGTSSWHNKSREGGENGQRSFSFFEFLRSLNHTGHSIFDNLCEESMLSTNDLQISTLTV